MKRRAFVKTGAIALTSVASGCCCIKTNSPLLGTCAMPATQVADHPIWLPKLQQSAELNVDIHAHIFNGHDVPMEEYFVGPVLRAQGLWRTIVSSAVRLAAGFIRAFAPTADQEYRQLCSGQSALSWNEKQQIQLTAARNDDVLFAEDILEVLNADESLC